MKKKRKIQKIFLLMLAVLFWSLCINQPENVQAGNTTVEALKHDYPDNTKWTNDNKYMEGNQEKAGGCTAFAATAIRAYYGVSFYSSTIRRHYNYDQIKPGDAFYYKYWAKNSETQRYEWMEHTVWVIGRNGNTLTVAEGNAYCIHTRASGRICWGRQLSLNSNIKPMRVYAAPYAINDTPQPEDTSYYYAKVQGTDGSLSINDRAASTSGGARQLGAIPENGSCKVYNSGAVGKWKRVVYKGVTGYAYSTYLVTGLNPRHAVDYIASERPGQVTLRGWAFDYDRPESPVRIDVYVGGPAGQGGTIIGAQNASNVNRPDLEPNFPGVGTQHGFDFTFQTSFTGVQPVYVYAINWDGGTNAVLGPYYVNIDKVDTQGPVISEVEITDVSESGYTVTCKAEDDYSGVARVQFPTWYADNNPYVNDSSWTTNPGVSGTLENGKYVYRVNTADYGGQPGIYNTHIYAWDRQGNQSECYVTQTTIKHEHNFTETVKKEPTCTEVGSKVFTCSCGEEYEQAIPPLGHPETEWRNKKEATVDEEGYTGDLCCTVCGEILMKGSVIPKPEYDKNSTMISVYGGSAVAGDEVTVDVDIENNPGIAGFCWDIQYDSEIMSLKSVKAGELLVGNGSVSANNNIVSWYTDTNLFEDGNLLQLTFAINQDTKEGAYYVMVEPHEGKNNLVNEEGTAVKAFYMKGQITAVAGILGDVNRDGKLTMVDVVLLNRHLLQKQLLSEYPALLGDMNGDKEITIADVVMLNSLILRQDKIQMLEGGSAAVFAATGENTGGMQISVEDTEVQKGDTVDIPVYLSGNTGIAGMALAVELPDGYTLNSITAGDILAGGSFRSEENVCTWYAGDNMNGDGLLLNLNVTIEEQAESGYINLMIKDNEPGNLCDELGEEVSVELSAGYVTVKEKEVIKDPDISDCVIQPGAFRNCESLVTVNLKETVTEIGEAAFADCPNLRNIYFSGDCPKISSDSFQNVTATAYYPYDNATWKLENLQNYGGNITWLPWNPRLKKPEKRALSICEVKVGTGVLVYDGKAKTPVITVTDGNYTLVEGKDYTISCGDNINAGTAFAIVQGAGGYGGALTKNFRIQKATNKITGLSDIVKTYSANGSSATVKASALGEARLTYSSSNSSVKVDQSGLITIAGKFIGKAIISVTAGDTTNYWGASGSFSVTVNPAGTSLYRLTNTATRKLNITWKKNAAVTGYRIQYSTDGKFNNNVKTKNIGKNSTTSVSFSGLTKGKKYYVRIRTYKTVNGVKYYSSWSKAKSITIRK